MFMNVDRIAPELRPNGSSSPHLEAFQTRTLEDRWIFSLFNRVTKDVNDALADYRFHEAANRIYDYFWGAFCDWYIELVKPRLLEGASPEAARVACANLVNLFDGALRLLHPVMPFITEEIWHAMYDGQPPLKSIAFAPFPQVDETQIDTAAEVDMAILQDLIASVRNLRAELKVEPKIKVPIRVYAHEPQVHDLIGQNRGAVERLGGVETIDLASQPLTDTLGARRTARFDVMVIYEKKINLAEERARLRKDLEKLEKEIANGQRQLSNEQFLAKASAQVIEGFRNRAQDLDVEREKIQSQLAALGQ
jgi:valyl-tRNA synthetase